jgi:ferritin
MQQNLNVTETFGDNDIIQILEEFEGEQNVEVMTADDFLTRCEQIGVPKLSEM